MQFDKSLIRVAKIEGKNNTNDNKDMGKEDPCHAGGGFNWCNNLGKLFVVFIGITISYLYN